MPIGIGEGGKPHPPLGSYSGKSGTYPGKFKNIRANLKMKTFFRDHAHQSNEKKRKMGIILKKTVFSLVNTLYIWKYFVLYIWEDSYFAPPLPPIPKKLFCSSTAMFIPDALSNECN